MVLFVRRRGLHVRDVRRVNGQQRTSNIRIDITVEGVTNDQSWRCGLEFDYANDESFYCRPLRLSDPWSDDIKASDDFLVPLFESYFGKLGLPNLMAKKNFYELAEHVPDSEFDPEISEKLDEIVRVSERATPAGD